MKKFLAFLLLLLFIILAWFSWKWYKENVACCATEIQVEETVKPVKKYGPLVFNWNSGKAITNNLWPASKAEILAGKEDNRILSIVGPYYKDEKNTSSFENMGLARADAIRQLLLDSIPTNQIEIGAKLVNEEDSAKTEPFGGTQFGWKLRNENIKEVDDKALIYFPYNSTSKLDNANINSYLKDVAESVIKSGKSISLTGYTDNIGRSIYNKSLGQKRANTVKNILVTMGVDTSKIKTSSRGEADPIATNNTEEGRQKNRRVELEIN